MLKNMVNKCYLFKFAAKLQQKMHICKYFRLFLCKKFFFSCIFAKKSVILRPKLKITNTIYL